MIDLHTHVLPGVDDGAETLEDAVLMCRLAARDGIDTVVATPHQRTEAWENGDPTRLEAARFRLQHELGSEVRVLLGGEIRVDSELLADLDRPGHGGAVPLAGSRYLLLEPSLYLPHLDLVELVHELRVGGWRPILAHPERVAYLAEDLELIGELAARGALFQLTAASLNGLFGRLAQSCSDAMLDRGLAHFVASDAHDTELRAPRLAEARARIAKRWGPEMAERLLETNPRAVIEDRSLPQETS